MRRSAATLVAAALVAAPMLAAAHGSEHAEPPPVEATGPAPLYEPPPPGSYELPPIGRVGEHVLLDAQGLPARLPGLADGQVAVVSFVYGGCGQACPAALATLQRLDRKLAAEPGLAPRVRLVTVSFDPRNDTPERMAELQQALARPAPGGGARPATWSFVTAADEAALGPVLSDYGQRVTRLIDPSGAETELLRHVLKVFLVDESLRIRNVYSAGLMDARLILNDIQTVLAE